MAEYSATRRTPRKHKRVVMKGTEQFDADGVKLEPGDMLTDQQRQSDDDTRIHGALPPQCADINADGRREEAEPQDPVGGRRAVRLGACRGL